MFLLFEAIEFVLICTAALGNQMHPLNQKPLLGAPKGNPIFPLVFSHPLQLGFCLHSSTAITFSKFTPISQQLDIVPVLFG